MISRIQKWGNSLALRIPKSLALEARLQENAAIELSLVDGKLVIEPAAPPPPTLEDLLRGVTKENLHAAWETGPAVGRELW